MRKFFYSISVLLFLGCLSFGYYETYRLADLRDPDAIPPFVETEGGREAGGYGNYYLKEENGYVLVCLSDQETVYETTSISLSVLPESLQEEIRHGKYVKDLQELYGFLENYSS